MVLGEIIPMVAFAFAPEDFELILADTITHPVESHVNGLGAFLFHCVIDDSFGTGIVCLDGGGWLRMA